MNLTHGAYRAILLPISAQTGRVFIISSHVAQMTAVTTSSALPAANPSRDDTVRVGERRTTLSRLLEVRGSRVCLLADVLDLVFDEQ